MKHLHVHVFIGYAVIVFETTELIFGPWFYIELHLYNCQQLSPDSHYNKLNVKL